MTENTINDLFIVLKRIKEKNYSKFVLETCVKAISEYLFENITSNFKTLESIVKIKKELRSAYSVLGENYSSDDNTESNILYTKSIIHNVDKSTQTSTDFLIASREEKPKTENLNLSKIYSGKQVKLGRKKRVNVPHVKKDIDNVKSSINKHNVPASKSKKYHKVLQKDIKRDPSPIDFGADLTEDTLLNNIESYNLEENIFVSDYFNHSGYEEQTKKDMFDEWNRSIEIKDGFLPIHDAAQASDIIMLERHCKILTQRMSTVDVLTEEKSETPLQIAITYNASRETIDILLNYKSDVLVKNDDGNNALHLCILYNECLAIFNLILTQVPIDRLLDLNYEGMSVLHLAALSNQYRFTKAILDYIDKCLEIHSIGRDIEDETQLSHKLQEFISSFINDEKPIIKHHPKKTNIINQKCMKTGRTPIFLAANISSEIICFLLLIHGADPRIEDLSGTDCSSLSAEITTNKLISTALYNTVQFFKYWESEQDIKQSEATKNFLIHNSSNIAETKKTQPKKRPYEQNKNTSKVNSIAKANEMNGNSKKARTMRSNK